MVRSWWPAQHLHIGLLREFFPLLLPLLLRRQLPRFVVLPVLGLSLAHLLANLSLKRVICDWSV